MKIGKAASATLGEPRPPSQAAKFEITREMGTSLVSDRGNFWAFLASLFFILAQITLIGSRFGNLPPQIPIFYSKTWGEGMLGQNIFIWILPILAILFAMLNFLVYFVFFRNDRFLARVLFSSNVVVSFMTFWGAMKIVTLLT